jgi:hypothetical protein
VLAAMLAKCLPSALRAHDAGLSRAEGKRKRIVAHRGEQPSFRGPTEPALPVTCWAYLRRIRPVPAEERDRRFTAWMHWFLGCLDRAFDWAGPPWRAAQATRLWKRGPEAFLALGRLFALAVRPELLDRASRCFTQRSSRYVSRESAESGGVPGELNGRPNP